MKQLLEQFKNLRSFECRCPNCGEDLFPGEKLLKKEKRTVLTVNCSKCWFFWPANEEVYKGM